MILEKHHHQRLFSITIGEMEQVLVLFRPRLSSTSDHGIQPLYHLLHLIPLLPNLGETAAVLVISVVDMAMEVVESVALSDVMEVEVVL